MCLLAFYQPLILTNMFTPIAFDSVFPEAVDAPVSSDVAHSFSRTNAQTTQIQEHSY